MMSFRKLFSVAIAITFVSWVGCSDSPSLGEVSGTVTLDGQPYANAQVEFAPQEGRPSSGVTDENGQYELTFSPDAKGALLGKHTVRISTVQQSTSDRGQDPKFKERIPAKFHSRTTLVAEVVAGDNSHDFTLTSN